MRVKIKKYIPELYPQSHDQSIRFLLIFAGAYFPRIDFYQVRESSLCLIWQRFSQGHVGGNAKMHSSILRRLNLSALASIEENSFLNLMRYQKAG